MKKLYINTLILFSPFLLMVMVNEVVRPTLVEAPFQYTKSFDLSGLTRKVVGSAMNPGKMKKEECTWYCHNKDSFCVNFHKKISFHQYIDDLYNSVYTQLLTLPEDTLIYPGHHYGFTKEITIEENIKHSKFFQCNNLDEFKSVMSSFEKNRRG